MAAASKDSAAAAYGPGLAVLRARARLTQEELAGRSGLAVRTIRDLERGAVAHPRWASVRLLAEALQVGEADVAAALGLVSPAGPANPPTRAPAPRQLPPAVADFTGRETLLAAIVEGLAGPAVRVPGSAVAVNLSGRPGVGKSCLAVAAAHRVADHFPDGQLFVELRTSSAAPRGIGAVLGDLLAAVGVDRGAIPALTAERAALFRERTADRRLLLVLDDAGDERQVQALLPALPSAVLVTSRRPLAGLPGVVGLDVDVLPPEDSATLLTAIVGASRADAEAEAVDRIAAACAGLPLALRIAGARLAARPRLRLGTLAAALTDEHRRLAELQFAELEVRAPLRLAVEAFPAEQRRALAVLGWLELPYLSLPAVSAALGTGPEAAQQTLDRLTDARLLDAVSRDGSEEVWYRFHDLVRLFALELDEPEAVRLTALDRLGGRLLAMAAAADAALPGTSDVLVAGGTARDPADPGTMRRIAADPVGWFALEEANLDAAVHQLVRHGRVEAAWELASQVRTYALVYSRLEIWRSTHEAALAACTATGDVRGTASMRFGLGKLRHEAHRLAEEEPVELIAATEAFAELGEVTAESRGYGELASWYGWIGEPDRAENLAQRSLRLARESQNGEALADALFVLGRLRVRRGEWSAARPLYDEALVLCRDLGKARAEGQLLWQLGVVRQAEGDLAGAEATLGEALVTMRAIQERRGEARVLIDLGDLCAAAGRPAEAIAYLHSSLVISDQVQVHSFRALALTSLGRLHQARGRTGQAIRDLTEALLLWQELGDANKAAQASAALAALEADRAAP